MVPTTIYRCIKFKINLIDSADVADGKIFAVCFPDEPFYKTLRKSGFNIGLGACVEPSFRRSNTLAQRTTCSIKRESKCAKAISFCYSMPIMSISFVVLVTRLSIRNAAPPHTTNFQYLSGKEMFKRSLRR